MPSSSCCTCIVTSALLISCLAIVIGIVGLTAGPGIIQSQVNNLWECVNVIEVLNGKRPMLRERGPFTYLEHRSKEGIFFNENFTVTYRQVISYTFVRNMSIDDEHLPVTMVNVPMVTIVSMVRNQSNITQDIVNFFEQVFNESLFVQHTAREWIWGYEDALLKAAKALPIIGDLIPDDHFGFFYGNNGTDDGLYTVFTGKTYFHININHDCFSIDTGGNDINRLNVIDKWNGKLFFFVYLR
jgi:hypothetical protein